MEEHKRVFFVENLKHPPKSLQFVGMPLEMCKLVLQHNIVQNQINDPNSKHSSSTQYECNGTVESQ